MEYCGRRYSFQLCINIVLLFQCITNIGQSEATRPEVTVNEGNDVTLPCEYSHPEPDPPPSVIEWVRQERKLPVFIKIGRYAPQIDPAFEALTYESLAKRINAMARGRMSVEPGGADLTIKRVEPQDEGWYECRVIFLRKRDQGPSPFINGTWAKLVVTAPPAFKYTPPDTITRQEGEVLLLRCRAVGRPTPVITWLKDGWPIKNGQDGIRLSEGELAVASLQKIHKGRYSCRAQNVEGQIEQSTTVHIQGAPVFVTFPQNATIKEGVDAMFSCRAEGYPSAIDYRWFYNGDPVESSEEIRGRYGALGDGTFIIYNVAADDGGTVTCRASNGFGKPPIASATLTVQFPARVTKMPSILYAGLGLDTTLPCPAVAVPPVSTVTWHRNGLVLEVDKDQRFSLGENGSLVISGVEQRDGARYTCIPYNILGTLGESTSTRLIVRYPPYFTRKPLKSYQAEIGKDLIISCEGTGDPPPHVSWVKLGDAGLEMDIQDKDDRLSYENENGNLTIRSVVKSDHGKWLCVLSNAVASVKAEVMIYVKYTTPHAVSNISVTTSRHSGQISWVPGYDGGYPQHFMIWYKRADMGDHSWQTQSVDGYRKMATVSNLEADTIYQFALLPENVLGSGQFSKTVTAKTKEIPPPTPGTSPPTVPSPSRMDNHITDSGLLLLMWQPPMDTREEDLLGYVVEFRMLQEEKTEESEEGKENIEDSSENPITEAPRITEAPLRSRRSLQHWNRLVYGLRVKRDAVPSTETPAGEESESEQRWSAWATLAPVNSNETSLLVSKTKIFRNQMYEFHVLAVSMSAYSPPSAPITVSTKGLDAYPVFHPAPISTAGIHPAVIAGVGAAIVFILIATILLSLWCHHRRQRKNARGHAAFTFGSLKEEKLDPKSKSKSESPSAKSAQSKSSVKGERAGPLSKLKKKMLKADVEMGQAYSDTDELVGIARKVSSNKQSSTEPENSGNGQKLIRQISRASDGKFHISDQSCSARSDSVMEVVDSNSLVPDNKSDNVGNAPSRSSGHSFASRSHSVEWDARSPLIQQQTPASNNGSESLEIDCSHSDIEVRYVKEGRDKGRLHSTSMSSLAGPRQYTLPRRELSPFAADSSMTSSMADSAYPSAAEFQQTFTHGARQSIVSPAPQMPPYAQYVHIRAGATPRRNRNPEYRVSSPPRFTDYNPTPSSPPKYRYHKHADQPGGHYHVSPRDSVAAPTERLVYDPRYTRIEPIYEMGYRPNHPPNRHSSFVIDTRRELPNHPHPHRAIQICRTTARPGAQQDEVNYPVPTWRDHGGSRYHTLPHQTQMSAAPQNFQASMNQDSVEASLLRHNANALRSPSHGGSSYNTNSLGRPRKKSHESGSSPRRRVRSVDDLTRDSPLPSDHTLIAEKSESVDLLSPRRPRTLNTGVNNLPEANLPADRTRDGCEAEDEASDVTVSSSSSSSRVPNSAVTSRHADVRKDQKPVTSVTKVIISSPTSPRADDSSPVSSLAHASHGHRPLEITSSGYDSHNTSHASESPAPSCSSPNATIRPSCHDHDRASTASSSDRSRKDTSSVDEKYEWDSEFAMESEILEALRHFGTHKRTGSVSQALVDEIQKLGMDKLHEMGKDELADLEKAVASRHHVASADEDTDNSSTTVDTTDMYTKESMERRCAALRKEYQRYQMDQITLSPTNETVFSTATTTPAANA